MSVIIPIDIAYLFSHTVVSCGDPGSLVNGFRIGDKFTYEERVIYDCNAGYKLQGSIVRKCEANGQWSGSTASCVGEELQIISTIYTRLYTYYTRIIHYLYTFL